MNNKKSTPWFPFAVLLLGLLIIGMAPILLRLAEAPGPVSATYRLGIASLTLLIPLLLNIRKEGLPNRKGILFAILAGLAFGLDMSFWTTGVMLAGATIPTLLGNTAPIWVGLGAILFLKEKLKPGFWLGLVFALIGVVVIMGINLQVDGDSTKGFLFGLIASFFYAAYFLFAQISRQSINTLVFFWLSATSSALVTLTTTFFLHQPLTGYPQKTWWLFLGMGVGIQVVGWLAISYAQGLLPASLVAPTLLGQPAVTAILAIPLIGERLTPVQLTGGIIVLLGVYIIHFTRRRSEPT